MKKLILFFAIVPSLAFAEPPTKPPKEAPAQPTTQVETDIHKPDGVLLPCSLAQLLVIYLSDRTVVAAQLQQGIEVALQQNPNACSAPKPG